MMSLTRPFETQNGVTFSLNHSKYGSYLKQGAMVKPCMSIVANIEGFALYKDSLHPFCNHYAIFEAIIQFSISVLFLVQTISKFKWGFGNIATSFR
jgi:K+ transporter